jgi:hypothetical protein
MRNPFKKSKFAVMPRKVWDIMDVKGASPIPNASLAPMEHCVHPPLTNPWPELQSKVQALIDAGAIDDSASMGIVDDLIEAWYNEAVAGLWSDHQRVICAITATEQALPSLNKRVSHLGGRIDKELKDAQKRLMDAKERWEKTAGKKRIKPWQKKSGHINDDDFELIEG